MRGNSPFGPHLNFPEQMVWDSRPWESTHLLPQPFPPLLPLKSNVENWVCGWEVGVAVVGECAPEPASRGIAGLVSLPGVAPPEASPA